jgi:hypothetical protein
MGSDQDVRDEPAGSARRTTTRSAGEPADRRSLERWGALALALAFVLFNAGFLALKGVQLGGDSMRYINGAKAWLEWQPLGGYVWAYQGYIAVVAIGQVIGAGLPGVVGFQIAVAAIAGAALVALGAALGGRLAGLVGAAFLVANPDVIRWHGYILTDSLYISAVVIVTYVAWRAAQRGGAWYALALLVLLSAATLRPTGLVLLPVVAAFWGLRGVVTRDWTGVALGTVVAVVVVWVVFSPRVQDTAGKLPGQTLRSGRVIYRHPAFRMEMPKAETPGGGRWVDDLRYVARHPGATLALGARRVAVEVAHVRPYYRTHHNVLIVGVLLPLYALAAIGLVATWRHPLTHLALGLIVGHLVLVAVSLADYDGRFLLYVLGPIGMVAAAGVGRLMRGTRPDPARPAARPATGPSDRSGTRVAASADDMPSRSRRARVTRSGIADRSRDGG